MTLDISKWVSQNRWSGLMEIGSLLMVALLFIAMICLYRLLSHRFYMSNGRATCIASIFYFISVLLALVGFNAFLDEHQSLHPFSHPDDTLTEVIEKGYGITSLSCGEDDLTENGWHSCTAVKDRRLLELKIDKDNTRVTVYDRHTGERLETAE